MDAALIQALSGLVLDHELSAGRAAELASEINPLCNAVDDTRPLLEFDDDAAAFLAFLERRSP